MFGPMKRFWKDVSVVDQDGGYGVLLDGRPVKTPAKAPLRAPNANMAEAVAQEWRDVEAEVDPGQMPFTRSVNAAIDKVTPQFTEVADMLAAYGGSDLLCYRADSPAELVARQTVGWDPMLDWAHETYGARLTTTVGLMPVEQDAKALLALAAPLHDATSFQLTALHDLIALSGSLVLGLGVARGRLSAQEGWALSRIDEDWQSDQWGDDDEAVKQAAIKEAAFHHADTFYRLA
ncbi:MAG: ATP12 family protein [Pseudomonadota bacterium]